MYYLSLNSHRSVLQGSQMPESKRMILLNTFKKLKQKVIWKWETEQMEGLPSNVKLSKWLPQQDILAHPNTKVFITHAGQSSTQETLCHKVPVVSSTLLKSKSSIINLNCYRLLSQCLETSLPMRTICNMQELVKKYNSKICLKKNFTMLFRKSSTIPATRLKLQTSVPF